MPEVENLLNQLNESQRKAVEYIDGPSLVIAGAGSGKTRVLTYKVAYLLLNGYNPWNILALTFTNKAASEMKQRVAKLVGDDRARSLNMGTFHSIFARILRIEAEQIGFHSNYTIYDESDSRTLIKNIIKQLALDENVYKPATVHNLISLAKNRLITAQLYESDKNAYERDKSMKMPMVAQIYSEYARRCKQANVLDFDDLLLYTYLLFDSHEDVRRKYVDRFGFILVDEYQDTNFAQQQIIYQLSKERQQVCVVGDDAQSIYSFRGADIDNILDFNNLYKGSRLFKLEQNYRSTQVIVKAANSLISHNKRQIRKDVFSRNDVGEALRYIPLYSDREETVVVCKNIAKIKKEENAGYGDFAILYRTNAQSRIFEEQLRKEGIPYRIYGGLSFYQRKEIKDVIAYFRLVVNPDDEEAFRRVINYPARGIGNVTLGKILTAAQQNGMSLWHAICHPQEAGLQLSKATMTKIEAFRQLILGFMEKATTTDVFSLGTEIVKESGIMQDLMSDLTPEGLSRKENLDEMLNGMKDFVESRREEGQSDEVYLADYLQVVSLLTDLDGGDDNATERVTLMTVHSAKGLEFPTVFVVGLEENLFPSPMSTDTPRQLEEERRLLYVAITRAEKHCILTSAQSRMRYGRMEFNAQSRFLRDIDPSLISVGPMTRAKRGEEWAPRRYGRENFQNANPVATQFKADPMPRAVPPRSPESPVDPFSEEFKRLQQQHGGRLRPLSSIRSQGKPSGSSTGDTFDIHEGCVIEHQRFGRGTVVKVEGTGENTKATVTFENMGTKQLLVKFARFKIISS